MVGQHWMLSVGVLWWFSTAPGCEKPCECQVQPWPPGIVLPGMVVVPQLPWAAADSHHQAVVRLGLVHREFQPQS